MIKIKATKLKKIFFIVTIFLVWSCDCNNEAQLSNEETQSSNEYALECIDVYRWAKRCENKEVICYRTEYIYGEALSCRFKDINQ